MKIQLITVGGKMPAWVTQGFGEYAKRLPRELAPLLVEVPLAARMRNANVEQIKEAEGQAIMQVASKNALRIMLDVKGRPWSTEDLAAHLVNWQREGRDLAFIIGGPDGLSESCLNSATEKWSLSNLTLPHPLVRIIFIEQLYRAWSILQNHPYHK